MWSRKMLVTAVVLLAFGTMNAQGEPQQAPSKSAAKPVRSMLICYLTNPTDYKSRSVGAALGRMLRYRASNLPQLSNLPPLSVVERVMRQERLSRRLDLDLPNALKVAKASGQEWTVIGSVRQEKDGFIARVEIYGTATGKPIGRPIVASGLESELQNMEAELAAAFFSSLGLSLSPQQRADLRKPLTKHYKAVKLLGDYLLADAGKAKEHLNNLRAMDPSFPLAGVHQLDALLDAERFSEALTLARQWGARLPGNRDFASYEFGALLGLGRFNEANDVLNRLEARHPDSFSAALLRHWLYIVQGDYGSAVESARRLTALNPASAEGYARVASSALTQGLQAGLNLYLHKATAGRAGEFAAAFASVCSMGEKAVELDPQYEEVWLTLMAGYREQANHEKSEKAYSKIMAINASNCDAKSSLALTYLCQKKVQSARKMLEDVSARKPGQADVVLGLAVCAKAEGDSKTAVGLYNRAIALDKRCGDVAYLRNQKSWPIQLAEAATDLRPKAK